MCAISIISQFSEKSSFWHVGFIHFPIDSAHSFLFVTSEIANLDIFIIKGKSYEEVI